MNDWKNISVPPELHYRWKVLAARKRLSMMRLLEQMLSRAEGEYIPS